MFSKTTWDFKSEDLKIVFNKIPNYFNSSDVNITGELNEGSFWVKSYDKKDDIWGAIANITVEWSPANPLTFHHGIQVKKTIDIYSAINVIVTQKEQSYLLSHDITIWHGRKQKFEQRRMYSSKIVHATIFCDQTNRLFEIHAEVLDSEFYLYEKPLKDFIYSFECHAV